MRKFHEKPNAFVEQVSINVMNMERSVSFYKEIIGLQVLEREERKVVFTADGIRPLLILEQPEEVQLKEKQTTGLYHFALLLPTRADLAMFLSHLFETNTKFGAADHLVSEAIYLDDPDGNGIEVYWDRPAHRWSWDNGEVEMATNPLDVQGILAESDAKWNKIPQDTLMGHIHLHVADLEQTERFYADGLGFSVVSHYPGALFMATGGYHHHLGLNVWNGVGAPIPKENSVGLNWYTIKFANEEVRKNIINNLNKIGAVVSKLNDEYITTDPSGNKIRLEISS